MSSLNPKRSRDKALLLSALGGKVPEGPSLMRSFDIHWRGIRIPLAYGVFSYLCNLYGGARVRLGKKYEIFH